MIDFFNAIEKHQSELKRKLEDAGPTELRQSKIIKDLKESDITDKIEGEQVIFLFWVLKNFKKFSEVFLGLETLLGSIKIIVDFWKIFWIFY